MKDSLVIIRIAKRATEVGDLLKTGATVALATAPKDDKLELMINEAVASAVDKAVVAVALQPPRQGRRGPWGSNTKNWRCHYCNSTNHQGGWKACPERRKYDPSWTPRPRRRAKLLAGRVEENPSRGDFPENP